MDSNLRERKSELASAEASEDAVRGKGSVEERPLFLFFAPLPPLSHGGRALCWIRRRSNIHTWENDKDREKINLPTEIYFFIRSLPRCGYSISVESVRALPP